MEFNDKFDEKDYFIFLKKSEIDDNSYSFYKMEKILNEDIFISNTDNFGKKLSSDKSIKIYNLNLSNFESLIIDGSDTESFVEFYESVAPGAKYIAIKIGKDIFDKLSAGGEKTERVCVWVIINIFNCINKFKIVPRDFRKNVIAFSNKKEKEWEISEKSQLITNIISEGKKELEQNAYNTSSSKVISENVGKKAINELNQDDIIKMIKQKIKGQDKVIYDVVETLFLNQKLIDMGDEDVLTTSKANILIDGPTGTGKTFLLREVSKLLALPMVIASSTSFSTTGYKGTNLEELLIKLLDEANGDLELAERGIIVFDEFDKLGTYEAKNELAMRKGLQEELLTYISGAKFLISYKGKSYEFDTSKITFVALGAFTNLREKKIAENNTLGFQVDKEEIKENTYIITPDDYINEGIIRELVGRFTTLTNTDILTEKDLICIMKESTTSPLLATKKIVASCGKELSISDDILQRIAQMVLEMNTGARGLQTVFNPINRAILREMQRGNAKRIEITDDLLTELQRANIRRY